MEFKNVAVLGQLGAPGPEGFGADPATREVVVYGGDGQVIQRHRAVDTVAAADSQIEGAGYKRVGAWENGQASIQQKSWFGRRWPALLGVAIVVAIFAGCTSIGTMMSDDSPQEKAGPTQYDAKYFCEQFVEDKLKAPSTAKFRNEIAGGSGSRWTVSGVVESQNSFGGMVQNAYHCSLTYAATDDSWRGTVTFPNQ